ncbi:hypothetical protein RA210_U160086 [Rubrivivax sp. A210]|uniref:hypothetical protein n=1 Tax=Rubrivivax sp. A210 TaxID=2772301 RepID=UPI0019183791|nr:hypothetical protein [Rubrivivax sp. A210]CAD5371749.1 hypothetical protein RA210_U160086 [Rubrivivax sp. A210]
MVTEPAEPELQLTLQLHLRLRRTGPLSQWSAELSAAPGAPPLRFATLPALIGYIARLDRIDAPRGEPPGLR